MSSVSNPHYMYLFEMKNGKQKLAYGASPEDALDILSIRLTEQEMQEILPDKYKKIYEDKGIKGSRAAFWGMITNIDENMGRLMKKLDDLGLAEDTILIFLTDNGTAAGSSGVMRGRKGSDLLAVEQGRISVTPIDLDFTNRRAVKPLAQALGSPER